MSPENLAYSRWLASLNAGVFLDDHHCRELHQMWVDSGVAGIRWSSLTATQQDTITQLHGKKHFDWCGAFRSVDVGGWWRTVARFVNGAFICLPAVLLMSSWLVFWFAPEAGVMLVEQLRKDAAESLVRWMAGGLTSLYVITGLLWVMVYFVMNLPANGFREAFLAKVMAHQQRRNEQPQTEAQAFPRKEARSSWCLKRLIPPARTSA